MPRKLRVAVLFGGRSAEHEISILSARNVVAALDRDRFEPILIGIDKSGRWVLQEEALLLASARDPRLARLNEAAPDVTLPVRPARQGATSLSISGQGPAAVDVVFPVLHGPMGEDGSVQGMLELAGVPYVGAGVLGSAVGMDKDVMKRLLEHAEIPVAPYRTVTAAAWAKDREAALATCEALGSPLFVKPCNMGSSVGIGRAADRAALVAAIDDAFRFDRKVLVERAVEGVRELECSVLGNDDPIASVAGEIVVDHPDGFYSYAAKYIDERGARIVIPAPLTPAQMGAVQLLAIRTFKALECAGLARVDFFLSGGGDLYVNEINTMPGFTNISMYPKLWEATGIEPSELVGRLIALALERAEARKKLETSV